MPFGVETVGRSGSTACSTRSGRTSRWPRRDARGSTPSASSTRARPACRPPSSPGPPDADERSGAGTRHRRRGTRAGLRRRPGPARAGRRALRPRRCRLVVDGPPDAGHGRGAVDRPGHAGLVPRGLGRDDGRDDVPVGRADGRAVLPDDQAAVAAVPAAVRRRATWSPGPAPAWSPSRSRRSLEPGRRATPLAWDRAGRWVAGATLRRRGGLRADPAQGRLPRQVPQPARLPARLVAGRPPGARSGWARRTAPGASAAAGR